MYVGVYMPQHVCGSQRTILCSQFSPFNRFAWYMLYMQAPLLGSSMPLNTSRAHAQWSFYISQVSFCWWVLPGPLQGITLGSAAVTYITFAVLWKKDTVLISHDLSGKCLKKCLGNRLEKDNMRLQLSDTRKWLGKRMLS